MRSILFIETVTLVIGWTIGTFAYSIGGLIDVMLVIAIISALIGFLQKRRLRFN